MAVKQGILLIPLKEDSGFLNTKYGGQSVDQIVIMKSNVGRKCNEELQKEFFNLV